MAFVVPVTAGSDWHSGWSEIVANSIVRIIEHRQSINYGGLIIEGVLLLEGKLFLEA